MIDNYPSHALEFQSDRSALSLTPEEIEVLLPILEMLARRGHRLRQRQQTASEGALSAWPDGMPSAVSEKRDVGAPDAIKESVGGT